MRKSGRIKFKVFSLHVFVGTEEHTKSSTRIVDIVTSYLLKTDQQ